MQIPEFGPRFFCVRILPQDKNSNNNFNICFVMKKIILILAIALFPMMCMAQSQNRKSAHKIAESLGACTLPDGSMGKMVTVERETTQSYSSSSTTNSGSHSTTGSASFEAGLTGAKGAVSGSHTYNSGSSSQTGSNTSTTRTKEECRPIPRW